MASRATWCGAAQAALLVWGFSELTLSSALYAPYLVLGGAGLACLALNQRGSQRLFGEGMTRLASWVVLVASAVLSLLVCVADYSVWDVGGVARVVLFLGVLGGCLVAFGNVLLWVVSRADRISWRPREGARHPLAVFLVALVAIAAVDLTVLFLCKYPGNLSYDSIFQMNQIATGAYTNHHPFWHTMLIKLALDLGNALFGNVNAAVATYSVFSIIFMACSFAFALATMEEAGAPRWATVLCGLFFAFAPYHVMYSFTMWKDVLFGGAVLLFCTFLYRVLSRMALRPLNWVGLVLSGLEVCLWRSNGQIAFVLALVAFLLLYRLREKATLVALASVLVASFILKYPVLAALGVPQPAAIESLSVPVQQVALDIKENDDFTEHETELLQRVVDMDTAAAAYTPYVADPVKWLVDGGYISEHPGEYLQLYLARMAKHPMTYLKGWANETCGYYNAGYDYGHWTDGVYDNDFGVVREVRSEGFGALVDGYLSACEHDPFLQLPLAIGLFDWLAFGALAVCAARRDRLGAAIAVPEVAVVFTLLLSTPIAYEFRYDYAVFCALPFVLVMALRPLRHKGEDEGDAGGVPALHMGRTS